MHANLIEKGFFVKKKRKTTEGFNLQWKLATN